MTNTQQEPTLADIFRPTGSLNTEAIRLLIGWAEGDRDFILAHRGMEQWGSWEQGTWADVQFDAPNAVNPDTETVDVGVALTEYEQAVANGTCQSSFCMAGQAVVQAGYRLGVHPGWLGEGVRVQDNTSRCVEQRPTGRFWPSGRPVMEDVPGRDAESIPDVAQEILGITFDERDQFFNGSNTIEDLKIIANEICRHHDEPIMYPEVG